MPGEPMKTDEVAVDCARAIVGVLGENPEWMKGAVIATRSLVHIAASMGGMIEHAMKAMDHTDDEALGAASEQVCAFMACAVDALADQLLDLMPDDVELPALDIVVDGAYIVERHDD